jgi:hypothetical protein
LTGTGTSATASIKPRYTAFNCSLPLAQDRARS